MVRETISPYSFPGIDVDLLDPVKYPFIVKYRQNSTIEQIYYETFRAFKVKREDIMSKSRKQEYVFCRMTLAFIFRNILGISYSRIGKYIGDRDHASAIHNERTFMTMYSTSKEFRKRVSMVFDNLNITEKRVELMVKNKLGRIEFNKHASD